MIENINCPFCGNIINKNDLKCPFCNELFEEPQLKSIKFKELGIFTAIDVLTLGFFSTLWFFINGKALNSLSTSKKDCLKLNWLVILLAMNGAVYLFYFYQSNAWMILCTCVQILIYIALTYRSLRLIQKYTLTNYNVQIEANPYYTALFNIFYLVHYVETYTKRVQGKHEFFEWKSVYGIILIILMLIIIFIMRFYYEIYNIIG